MEEIIIHPAEHYLLRAGTVIPVEEPPLHDACVEIKNGLIISISPWNRLRGTTSKAKVIDLEDLVLFPSLANMHTHLELSALRFRVPPAGSFTTWLVQLLKKRESLSPDEIVESAKIALSELWREGISVVCDVGNTGLSVPLLCSSKLQAFFFQEILCFKGIVELRDKPKLCNQIYHTYSAHSPYTVTPIMIQAIKSYCNRLRSPFMIHCAESKEEVEFLLSGEGALANFLRARSRLDDTYQHPGLTPVAYLESLGVLDENTILVHAVHLSDEDLAIIKHRRPTLCLCPRSNLYTGAGLPPLPKLLQCGVRLVLGTDSLASVDRLSIFEEIKVLHNFFPDVPARELLLMATRNAAKALGLSQACSLRPGVKPDLLALRLPYPPPKEEDKALAEFLRGEKEIVYRIYA